MADAREASPGYLEFKRLLSNWDGPREVAGNPFRLDCVLGAPATLGDVESPWDDRPLPPGLEGLWLVCGEASLFIDVDYGQWGLRILSPAASAHKTKAERASRPTDLRPTDIVIGEFLGDLEMLVLDGDGRPLVALPLDPRPDWYRPAGTLPEFLVLYLQAEGNKFWEAEVSRIDGRVSATDPTA